MRCCWQVRASPARRGSPSSPTRNGTTLRTARISRHSQATDGIGPRGRIHAVRHELRRLEREARAQPRHRLGVAARNHRSDRTSDPRDQRDHEERAILAISVITLAETRFGFRNARWGATRIEREERRLAGFLQVPLDMKIMDKWARLKHVSVSSGWNVGDNDLWIAATASTRGYPLVTCDADHGRIDDPAVEVIPPAAADALSRRDLAAQRPKPERTFPAPASSRSSRMLSATSRNALRSCLIPSGRRAEIFLGGWVASSSHCSSAISSGARLLDVGETGKRGPACGRSSR
ncbi:MAG: type II toxin-antitoxin system VapC family toxin [Solirubrobacteraceae bacterium]